MSERSNLCQRLPAGIDIAVSQPRRINSRTRFVIVLRMVHFNQRHLCAAKHWNGMAGAGNPQTADQDRGWAGASFTGSSREIPVVVPNHKVPLRARKAEVTKSEARPSLIE